jgi:ribosomal protein S18 acetylase RimI-like enzyme
VTVRIATAADLPALEALWRAFSIEVPEPPHETVDPETELGEVRTIVADGLGFVAEADGAAVGFALARVRNATVGRLTDLYVVPEARRTGLAQALVEAVAEALGERGVTHVDLEVMSGNTDARAVYQHWGFVEHTLVLAAPVDTLRERLTPGRHATSFASIHVQTDDAGAVERAAAAFAPRIGSRGWRVSAPRSGWTAIYDEVVDTDPTALIRYAREVSSRLGAVVIALSLEVDQVVRLVALERGGIVDEYLSVPEFYGPLPPGDVIGLAANPTVLHRLTGAQPDAIRAVARTAVSPAELPPAQELLALLAQALGIEGAEHGYADAG